MQLAPEYGTLEQNLSYFWNKHSLNISEPNSYRNRSCFRKTTRTSLKIKFQTFQLNFPGREPFENSAREISFSRHIDNYHFSSKGKSVAEMDKFWASDDFLNKNTLIEISLTKNRTDEPKIDSDDP